MDKLILSSLGYSRSERGDIAAIKKEPDIYRVEIMQDGSHLMEWWRQAARWGDTPDIVDERALEYHKAGPRGGELHWAASTYDVKSKLPLIKCPTLVLSGTRDPHYPMREEIGSLIPISKIITIENGPCYISRVMPKEFAEAILTFLENPTV